MPIILITDCDCEINDADGTKIVHIESIAKEHSNISYN